MGSGKSLDIGFVGAGNMAFHLSRAFHERGHRIVQVISRNPLSANRLAELTGADDSDRISDLNTGLDLLFLTIPDDALVEVIQDVSAFHQLVVHTCGSCPMSLVACRRDPKGVFYPLMSFSPGREVTWEEVPIFIEASDPDSLEMLRSLALELTPHVFELDSLRRMQLHLAAVWASNFSNHMLARAFDLSDRFGIPRKWLQPLIRETFEKAMARGASESQTGPAIRHDRRTLRKHRELLAFDPELQDLYDKISSSVQHFHDKPR